MKKKYRGETRHTGGVLLPSCTSVFFLCISLFSFSQGGIWRQKQSLGLAATSRYGAVSFSIGDKGYVGTGFDISPRNDFWEYNPSTNVWTQKANLPGGVRSSATGFSIGHKGYIGMGDSANFLAHYNDFWEYDPATNIWTRKADFGGGGRSGTTGFSIGSKGYAGTGINNSSTNKNDFWQFDPATNVWTQKANFGGGVRNLASGFSIGNKGYIGLGTINEFEVAAYGDFWEYDPAADIWVQKADFGGGARWGATGFSVGNKGFLGTGNNNFLNDVNDFWEFDPVTNVWVQKANFGGSARVQAISFSIGNKGYLGTGNRTSNAFTFGPANDFWAYDTALDGWAQKANFGGGPRMNAVGFSIADKGYVGTGYDGSPKKDFWEYDPRTNTWMQKADFAGGERREATGFGVGDTGYVGQGWVRLRTSFSNDLWKYDPVTNAWLTGVGPGSSLPRAEATTFRIGGKEYVGMGYYIGSVFSDFWEYDPATGAWTQKANADASASGPGLGIGNKGYVVGNGVWEYDPTTNVWTKKANPGAANPFVYAFSIRRKGYALTTNNDFWEYDPAKDAWANRAPFPGPARIGATAFSIGHHGYFGFGYTTDGLKNDFWEYIPSSAAGNDSTNDSVMSADTGTNVNGLIVRALPNPTRQSFTLVFHSNNDQPIFVRVTDLLGRLIEIRTNAAPNGTLQIGSSYRPGNYFVQAIQGKDRVTLRLLKQLE